jgi:hypothetical protein
VLALICTRELVLLPLMLLYEVVGKPRQQKPLDFRASPAGKITTVAQFASVAAVILVPALVWPLAVIASLTGLVTAAVYAGRGLESLEPRARVHLDVQSRARAAESRTHCNCGSALCKHCAPRAEHCVTGAEHCV